MKNGDGLRVVLWVAGCSHGCKDCHNKITWDPNGGILFGEEAKQELFQELEKDYIAGITFSGGDPLHSNNHEEMKELAKEIKKRYKNKTIWLYTGDEWENIKPFPIMTYIDVLVDGEFVKAKKDTTLQWRGSSNQRVIDVQKTLKEEQVILHAE